MTDIILPEGWVFSNIKDAISIHDLISDGDWIETKDQDINGNIRIIQLADIGDGEFRNKSKRYITSERFKFLKCKFIEQDDVLIARMPDPLGRACIFPKITQQAVTVVDVCFVRTKHSAITYKILQYWINSPYVRLLIFSNASGTTRQRITRKKLEQFILPIPPIAEQEEIAQRVDRAIGHVDELKSRLETLLTTLKTFRQSVLNAAVTGKLINNPIIKYKSLITCVDVHNGKRKPVSLEVRRNIQGDIPYYGATGIVDYLNDFTHNGRYLLVGEDGANLLTKSKELAYIVQGKIWVNNHAHVLKEKKCMSLDFIKIVINSLELKAWVTGSAQPKLTKKSLESLPIPDFSLAEQEEIVKRVEAYFALADQIEKQVQSALDKVNLLTQSILAKAFRGELTKEWRKKNPELISGENSAEALLKRIKAEKDALEKPLKKTKRTKVKTA